MTDLRKAAEMALKALENTCMFELLSVPSQEFNRKTIKVLRQALAQPKQEPVSDNKWKNVVIVFNDYQPPTGNDYDGKKLNRWSQNFDVYLDGIKGQIYTAPPKREWVELTSEDKAWAEMLNEPYGISEKAYSYLEAKLKEKNT